MVLLSVHTLFSKDVHVSKQESTYREYRMRRSSKDLSDSRRRLVVEDMQMLPVKHT